MRWIATSTIGIVVVCAWWVASRGAENHSPNAEPHSVQTAVEPAIRSEEVQPSRVEHAESGNSAVTPSSSLIGLGNDLTEPPIDTKLPKLAPGLPESVMRTYRMFSSAADRLQERAASGPLSEHDKRNLAQLRGVVTLIKGNRYWYVGPKSMCPKIPASSSALAYFACHIDSDNFAVFELSQTEFPGSYSPPAEQGLGAGNPIDDRLRAIEGAKKDVKK